MSGLKVDLRRRRRLAVTCLGGCSPTVPQSAMEPRRPARENKCGSLLPNLLPNAVGLVVIETDRERCGALTGKCAIPGGFVGGRGGFVNVCAAPVGQAASQKPVSSHPPTKRRAAVAGISYRGRG